MSFLTSVRATSRSSLRPSYALSSLSSSPFHSSAMRPTLKESDKNRDDLPNFYEAQKNNQVENAKNGKAKWNAELASVSEADVKADRGEIESTDKSWLEMQERTKNMPNRKAPVHKTH
ncbi:methyltransferase domain family protein [Penicillium lagena]|uniref:methyltransferase domain family protein n=1 Tax=Penicillium lagena TaxID=94218 RepID=UPI0025413445|nr:methyltransferase domain family protein [Penicillium lagena]KAJ5610945.1 methyltransferase domain family protein [Penicillium lagena]